MESKPKIKKKIRKKRKYNVLYRNKIEKAERKRKKTGKILFLVGAVHRKHFTLPLSLPLPLP